MLLTHPVVVRITSKIFVSYSGTKHSDKLYRNKFVPDEFFKRTTREGGGEVASKPGGEGFRRLNGGTAKARVNSIEL